MLHHAIEITRLLIIAYPIFFAAMAGLDLMLRIANAFTASTSDTPQTQQAVEQEPMPALEPVVRTSPETQTEKEVENEPVSELEPGLSFPFSTGKTCYEHYSTCPEQQQSIETPLSQLKRYKLHGYEVVPVAMLPITLPATVKRYKLRGMAVVRLCDIA